MPETSGRTDAEQVLGGRYRLVRSLARGGMAEVWEGRDEILGRPVAVKVLHAHLAADASFRERFRREAIAAARLAHPNVVATYDTGVDDGVAYIVMELVHGPTLRQVLADQGALSPQRATEVAVQVADALSYAHKAGIVHRDVKPANILVCDDHRVKVTDFGIAKAALPEDTPGSPGPDLTQSGAIVGTAKYLSPEQVNGDKLDGRSDVYALGVVLYEMLCGRPPFSGDTDVAIALQHVSGTPPSPRQVRAGVPRDLEAIVLRAMAKTPDLRYPNAANLESALLSVRLDPDDTVVQAAPEPTPLQDAPSFAQSERSWLVPVVLIVVLAVTLGIVGVLFARSETGRRLLDSSDESGAQSLTIGNALAFDPPPGSGREHDEELPNLFDGDSSTAWSTEEYADNTFGGLKDGVGFVVEIGRPTSLGELEVESPTRGWAGEVYVADSFKSATSQWGEPVASRSGIGGNATFDLEGAQGRTMLVWITDLGEGNESLSVNEVRITP